MISTRIMVKTGGERRNVLLSTSFEKQVYSIA
jgi:hypothetical protein